MDDLHLGARRDGGARVLADAWAAKAGAIETVPIRLEANDIRVVETALVWVPTR